MWYQIKITYYFFVIVAVSSSGICLSDNIQPPLENFEKEISDISTSSQKKATVEIIRHSLPVVSAELYRTPSIRIQIARYQVINLSIATVSLSVSW